MQSPQPLFHTSSPLTVEGMPLGWTARVLHLLGSDGVVSTFWPLIEYIVAHPRHSSTWQDGVVRAVGLFWDYSRAMGAETALVAIAEGRDVQRAIYRGFASALVTGTIVNGEDPSGLYWPRTGVKRARELISSIESFVRWRHEENGSNHPRSILLPNEPKDPLTLADYLVWGRIREISMLKHLKGTAEKIRKQSIVDIGDKPHGDGAEEFKFFPPGEMERLFWKGYERPGMQTERNPFLRFYVRDQMMALLDGYGGFRHCEGLHLWVQDIVEEPG